MNVITGKFLPRRTFLRGVGATVALPFLDSMVPLERHWRRLEGDLDRTRLVAIEMVHGAAGTEQAFGAPNHLWSPAEVGRHFDLSSSALQPLEPFHDYLTIISDTDVRMAEAYQPTEIGGDHYRSSATFLTQAHPRQTEGSDVFVGTSLDQIYSQRFGQDTPIPSLQLCIENVDQAGGCSYGYGCAYTDAISWASPTHPLPMIRNPRTVFEMLFGSGGTEEQRQASREASQSILDWISEEVASLKRRIGPADRRRLDGYLEDVREIERRIQGIEQQNLSGEPRELPEAPAGVPDSFEEHMRLMFDLQVLAFETDITRVISFKPSRDVSARVYPESGVDQGFHPASHHGGRPERVLDFFKINKHHVGMLPYFLEKLRNTPDGDSNLLDRSMIIYGSPMADGNLHNHRRCPLILMGGANGKLEGGMHLRAPGGTPMANVMLTLLHKLGLEGLRSFGDSTGAFSLDTPSFAD